MWFICCELGVQGVNRCAVCEQGVQVVNMGVQGVNRCTGCEQGVQVVNMGVQGVKRVYRL
jgi:hypothetical protein